MKAFNCKILLISFRSAGSVKTLFLCYKFLFKYFRKQLNGTEQNRLSEFQDNKCVLYKFTKVFFNQSKFSIVIGLLTEITLISFSVHSIPFVRHSIKKNFSSQSGSIYCVSTIHCFSCHHFLWSPMMLNFVETISNAISLFFIIHQLRNHFILSSVSSTERFLQTISH